MVDIKIVEKKEQQKPLTVVFCIPGSSFSGTFFKCWTDFLSSCIASGIRPILSNGEDTIVYYARNKCLGVVSFEEETRNLLMANSLILI